MEKSIKIVILSDEEEGLTHAFAELGPEEGLLLASVPTWAYDTQNGVREALGSLAELSLLGYMQQEYGDAEITHSERLNRSYQ